MWVSAWPHAAAWGPLLPHQHPCMQVAAACALCTAAPCPFPRARKAKQARVQRHVCTPMVAARLTHHPFLPPPASSQTRAWRGWPSGAWCTLTFQAWQQLPCSSPGAVPASACLDGFRGLPCWQRCTHADTARVAYTPAVHQASNQLSPCLWLAAAFARVRTSSRWCVPALSCKRRQPSTPPRYTVPACSFLVTASEAVCPPPPPPAGGSTCAGSLVCWPSQRLRCTSC